jgi:hypothetical protein
MRSMWLDPEDSQTELYVGPPVRTYATDALAVPSLVAVAAPPVQHAPLQRHARAPERPLITPITIGLAALCVIAGVSIGRWISHEPSHDRTSAIAAKAPAASPPAAIAMHAKPAKPTVEPIVEPAKPAPVVLPPTTLRVETVPAGATIAFVGSDGATTIVGTSPVDATIDPARTYDVLVTLADHVSRVEHVAPNGDHHLALALATTH